MIDGSRNLFLSPPDSVRRQTAVPVRSLGNQIASPRKLLQPVLILASQRNGHPNSGCSLGPGPKAVLSAALAQGPTSHPSQRLHLPGYVQIYHAALPALPHHCHPMAVPKAPLTLDPWVPPLYQPLLSAFSASGDWHCSAHSAS